MADDIAGTTTVGMGPDGTGAVMLGTPDWVGAAAGAGTAGIFAVTGIRPTANHIIMASHLIMADDFV